MEEFLNNETRSGKGERNNGTQKGLTYGLVNDRIVVEGRNDGKFGKEKAEVMRLP